MDYMSRIKALRKANGVSQAKMGELLETTQQQYFKYETRKQELPIRHLITICKYFGVSSDDLLGLDKKA